MKITHSLQAGIQKVLPAERDPKKLDLIFCLFLLMLLPHTLLTRFYFLVLWDHGFHCGTLKLLEGH